MGLFLHSEDNGKSSNRKHTFWVAKSSHTHALTALGHKILKVDKYQTLKFPRTGSDSTPEQGKPPVQVTPVTPYKDPCSAHVVRPADARKPREEEAYDAYAFASLSHLISSPSLSDGVWTNQHAKTFWKTWGGFRLCSWPPCSTSTQ